MAAAVSFGEAAQEFWASFFFLFQTTTIISRTKTAPNAKPMYTNGGDSSVWVFVAGVGVFVGVVYGDGVGLLGDVGVFVGVGVGFMFVVAGVLVGVGVVLGALIVGVAVLVGVTVGVGVLVDVALGALGVV